MRNTTMNEVTELRLRLLDIGIEVLPSTVGKEVFLKDWRKRPIDAAEVRSWEPHTDWSNTSGRMGPLLGLDLDIKDADVAEAAEQCVRNRYDGRGEIICRIGQPPKRALLFRTAAPFKKRKLTYQSPNGQTHAVEALGDGQQLVLYGYHAGAKRDYSWRGGRDPLAVPPAAWPLLAENELEDMLVELDELLVEQFGWTRTHTNGNGHASTAPHVDDAGDALSHLCYQGRGGGGNIHDTEFGCINALLIAGNTTDAAIEEVLAAVRVYAATDALCARWDWDKERRALEEMAYSFINKFPDYADRLPPELYAMRQRRRGQGIADPVLEYDRLRKCWHYPEPPGGPEAADSASTDDANGAKTNSAKANNQNGQHKPRIQLIPFDHLRPGTDASYLVDELIPLRGIVLIWGKRKCLKSFWTYDLGFHIARGMEYRGRTVLQGPVVYCAFEGAHGYKKRAQALRQHHTVRDGEQVPLYLVPGRINMIKEYPLLIAAVREQLFGDIPRMIVLDTLNKSLVGSENKDVDMAAYIVAAEALRDAFDCVVVIVHHCGYDETHPRGHTSLAGAVDAEYEVVREAMLVTIKSVTMRDGPEGFEIRSAAEVVEVGEDDTGKTITSLVIMPTDAPAMPSRKKGGRPNVSAPILVDALRKALADQGGIFRPEGERAAVHAVREEEVRRRFDDAYPAGETAKEKVKEATAEAYRRALQAACADGKIGKGCGPNDIVMLWFKVSPS